jgi:hypothetical protein
MKTTSISIILFFFIIFSSCLADTPKEIFIQINLDTGNEIRQSIKQHYEIFEIGYIKGNIEYENYGPFFTVERINYYYIKDNIRYFLGYIDKYGIYNKNSMLITKCPFIDTQKSVNIGLSSDMLQYPFDPIIVIKTGGNIWDTDPYGVIRIDFTQNTLIFRHLTN